MAIFNLLLHGNILIRNWHLVYSSITVTTSVMLDIYFIWIKRNIS